jgi:phospholipase C
VTSGILVLALGAATCSPDINRVPPSPPPVGPPLFGIHKIQHVVIIMQENRSFDSYFGTFPGADGIPMKGGVPAVCVPFPGGAGCLRPFHDPGLVNAGGPHTAESAVEDIDHGRMDGFIRAAAESLARVPSACSEDPTDPICSAAPSSIMGYRDARDIPNYWTYAERFVLQDHMFEPNYGWSLPSHLFMVSGWSAACPDPDRVKTCRPNLSTDRIDRDQVPGRPDFGWTDLTYLLYRHHVSWAYYVSPGTQPDCSYGQMTCQNKPQLVGTPEIWNPLPDFLTVHQDGQLGNIQDSSNFFTAARAGTLPAVSWVEPNRAQSEHWPDNPAVGQAWVTSLINAVMAGPDWNSTAIFLSWDDWGGLYDHVVPPSVDHWGYGIRVPGLLISPYARTGFIDHQILSFDAYLKFIEDDFLGGQRLDPRTDGRPDPRPDVRENQSVLGNLLAEFDFTRAPRPPMFLPLAPPPGPASVGP